MDSIVRRFGIKLFNLLVCCFAIAAPIKLSSQEIEARPIVFGQSFELKTKNSEKPRNLNVLLPPDYDEQIKAGTRFAVLYVLDGGTIWQDFFHIAGMVHQGNLWDIHQQLIVVGIESKDRKAEFTEPTSDKAELRDFPTTGKSAQFRDELINEIKPFIEAKFATNGEDAIIGESLAGQFIIETFAKATESFDHYIAISPSLWWNYQNVAKLAASKIKTIETEHKLWLSIANEGGKMQSGLDIIIKALKAAKNPKISYFYKPLPNETHGTIYHLAATQAVRDIFKSEKHK